MINGVCVTCGQEFTYQPSNKSGRFCSRKCFFKQYRGKNHKISVKCTECGKELLIYPHDELKRLHFCSQHCKAEWQSKHSLGNNNANWRGGELVERICLYCGKPFIACKRVVRRGDARYCSKSCDARRRIKELMKSLRIRPNKIEIRLIELMRSQVLPFRYTGDGQIIIGAKCPDFIHSQGERKVIEIFGSYWHSPLLNPSLPRTSTYYGTKEYYAKHRYDCLIIWESELKDESRVLGRIQNFLTGGD